MSKINPSDALNSEISLLEQKRKDDFNELKQQLHLTGESLKPGNILKSAVRDITGSPHLRSIIINAAVGLALGYIAKRLITNQQQNSKKQIIGNALQYGISFLASKRNNMLKAAGVYVANQIIESIRERRLRNRHLQNSEHAEVQTEG